MTLREQVALEVLKKMIDTNGTKHSKVDAAFEYADIFVKKSKRYKGEPNESENFPRVSGSIS